MEIIIFVCFQLLKLSSDEDVCAEKYTRFCFPWVVTFLVLNNFIWGNKLLSQHWLILILHIHFLSWRWRRPHLLPFILWNRQVIYFCYERFYLSACTTEADWGQPMSFIQLCGKTPSIFNSKYTHLPLLDISLQWLYWRFAWDPCSTLSPTVIFTVIP